MLAAIRRQMVILSPLVVGNVDDRKFPKEKRIMAVRKKAIVGNP